MGRMKKGLFTILAFGALAGSFHISGNALAATKKDTGTWKHNSRGWWYAWPDGSFAADEWLKINGKWYFFGQDGFMDTGWKEDGGKWYFLKQSGDMAVGWKKVRGEWYYFLPSGDMATGWRKVDGDWYFLDASGKMIRGWKKAGEKWYYLSADGAMVTDWNRINGKECLFDESGALVIDGVVVGEGSAMPESGAKDFSYAHDPKDNPSAMRDAVVNPDAVFGFSPNPESTRLGTYADAIDWADAGQVAAARVERAAYFASMSELYTMIETMQAEGKSIEEIARAVSKRRNEIRLEAYKDDPEGLAKVKQSNLETYGHEEGPDADDLFAKYGSWQTVMEKALSTNAGMDACLGFYDEYYFTYGLD